MGVFLVLLSALSFALSTYFGKIVTNTTDMSGIITSFSRFFLGAILMTIFILYKKKSFKAPDIKPIVLRSGFNSFAIMLYSAAYSYTTITNINMLNMTYPIFVVLFAPYYTKEIIEKKKYFYLVIVMLGSYIVADPRFGSINIGDILALGSGVMGAFSVMSLTNATRNNDGYIILFYVMVFGTILNLPFAYKDILSFEIMGIIPVFLSALFGVLGQVFITFGYRYVDSSTGSMVSSSRIVIAAIIGYIFLGEPFTTRIIIGMALITSSLIGLSGFFQKKMIS